MSRPRLDELLVARGLYPSRARARDGVLRGTISVDGEICAKPARLTEETAVISVADEAQGYVSRAALKLKHALDHFGIACAGVHALDIGASTGGFAQVLLERGAVHVTAIDVGHGQLHPLLRDDPRVTSIEGLNARDLTMSHLPHAPDLIVADVSFISLTLALPPALALAKPGAKLVALVKPQFEVGPKGLGKAGIVTDPTLRAWACDRIASFLRGAKWRELGVVAAPLLGGDGNQEFLIAAEAPC